MQTKKLFPILVIKQNTNSTIRTWNFIYRILEIKQEPSLKPYIEVNTELQKEAGKEGYKFGKQKTKLQKKQYYIW